MTEPKYAFHNRKSFDRLLRTYDEFVVDLDHPVITNLRNLADFLDADGPTPQLNNQYLTGVRLLSERLEARMTKVSAEGEDDEGALLLPPGA